MKGSRELSRSATNFSAAGCRLFCLVATFKTSLTKSLFLFRINIYVLVEDIFRIVLYFQLFQSLHNFFSLGALWEDSIFGQFLIDVVGPCLYDVIRVWMLCTNYRTNPVPDRKKKKTCKPSLRRSEDFQRPLTRNRRIPLILKYFRS